MPPLPDGVEHSYHPYGRHGATISYYHSGANADANSQPSRGVVVFISGFGVGGWHYERNLPALAKAGYSCFAPDLLGQGRSWPRSHPNGGAGEGEEEQGAIPSPPPLSSDSFDADTEANDDARVLRYSVDEWVEQLRRFIVEVALPRSGGDSNGKVTLVGNSLGGFLAVQLSARYPELIRGVALLNATPFWAFQKRVKAGASSSSWSWPPRALDGRVPAPGPVTTTIRRLWWDSLRRPDTVETLLAQVYANPLAFRDDGSGSSSSSSTAARILEATEHPLAVDAFVSIALSPKPAVDFDEALASAEARSVPYLLLYGAQDPWVHPFWARRVRRARPDAPLWLIDGSGHCPAHESPTAVNESLRRWMAWVEEGGGFVGGEAGGGGEGAPPPPPPPLAVGEAWAFSRSGGEGGGDAASFSPLLPFEAETTVRSDPGDPTTVLGKLERLLTAGMV